VTNEDGSTPHPARVVDCLLGGSAHDAADRSAAGCAAAAWPGGDLPGAARTARATLGRMVRYQMRELDIRQLLDVGAGLPTRDNTHTVARRAAAGAHPGASVVYVDRDPEVLGRARGLLAAEGPTDTSYLYGDLDDPDAIIRAAATVLDLSQPVGLLLFGVLHRVSDDAEAAERVRAMTDLLAPGSCLSFAHPGPHEAAEAEDEALELIEPGWRQHTVRRGPARVEAIFLSDLEPVAPGLVELPDWRPEPGGKARRPSPVWCGMGLKTITAGM
jgi:SAM-dependent methyltransferase